MNGPPLARLIAKLFARPHPRLDRRAARIGMEALEDRTVPASLGGYLWLDYNADGVKDSAEPNAVGVTVEAFDDTELRDPGYGVYASTTTGADGRYTFPDLPGDARYNLYFSHPGLTFTQFQWLDPILPPSGSVDDADLGLLVAPPPPPAPVVSVANVWDAVEGGAWGIFRFTRAGDTTAALNFTYTVALLNPSTHEPRGA